MGPGGKQQQWMGTGRGWGMGTGDVVHLLDALYVADYFEIHELGGRLTISMRRPLLQQASVEKIDEANRRLMATIRATSWLPPGHPLRKKHPRGGPSPTPEPSPHPDPDAGM